MLVLADVHSADDATLGVLRYIERWVTDLPALVIAAHRDDEVGPTVLQMLSVPGGPTVHRLTPARSPGQRRRGSLWHRRHFGSLYRLPAGKPLPFSVLVLAAVAEAGEAGPGTVLDAVLARIGQLEPAAQVAPEQLSVAPSEVELPLARATLGNLRGHRVQRAGEDGVP